VPLSCLKAAIEYCATVPAANHAANTVQIDSLFCVNDMIMKVVAVHGNHVEAAIISPSLQKGEIVHYDKNLWLRNTQVHLFAIVQTHSK